MVPSTELRATRCESHRCSYRVLGGRASPLLVLQPARTLRTILLRNPSPASVRP